jgi:UDP-N-acetylmuramyl pentapeptide phosphotransferase/UDP-N-acetylglucosamine-1-phosphate transferase
MLLIQAIKGVFALPQLTVAIWGMAASFVLCLLLVLTKGWHGGFTMDSSIGIQKFHTVPTPRIGGVPIVLGLIVAWGKAPVEVKQLLTPVLIAGMPAFFLVWPKI